VYLFSLKSGIGTCSKKKIAVSFHTTDFIVKKLFISFERKSILVFTKLALLTPQ
jgi:hypothetical protein